MGFSVEALPLVPSGKPAENSSLGYRLSACAEESLACKASA